MTESDGAPPLRADARRNVERIRRAAVEVFREKGLTAPLEDVAAAAGVSKATIFNRLGGRAGLIDAVLDDVVAAELMQIIDDARAVAGIRKRVDSYLRALRDLQYRHPAVNDVLLQEYRESSSLLTLCHAGEEFHDGLVAEGNAAGILVEGFTPGDFQALTRDTAVALRYGGRPSREDYDRRTAYMVRGILA